MSLRQAAELLQNTGTGAPVSWEIVVRFYSALHLATACLNANGGYFDTARHDKRAIAIAADFEFTEQVKRDYFTLKSRSENVRYSPAFEPSGKTFEEVRSAYTRIMAALSKLATRRGLAMP